MTTPLIEDDLRTKEFNRISDKYFTDGSMTAEDYDSLTPRQRDCIQWAKRIFKRLNKEDDRETY
jgi:hypothetical protein